MLSRFFNNPSTQQFCSPTQVIMGSNARNRIWDVITEDTTAVLVVDKQFCNDDFVQAVAQRTSSKVTAVVTHEPSERFVRECLSAVAGDIDTVVAIGGGSTIDTAKAMTAFLRWGKIYIKDVDVPRRSPYLIALPTTVGTGSEVSRYYVLSDEPAKRKRASRAWTICPDLALVDPEFLVATPDALLISSSFDAFCHLWETYVSRTECSPFNAMLAKEGLVCLVRAIDDRSHGYCTASAEFHGTLQFAGVLGGIALSNVRTGMIHNAAEALAAQITIPHSLALMVFFHETVIQYEIKVTDLISGLGPCFVGESLPPTLGDLIAFWERVWHTYGLDQSVRDYLHQSPLDIKQLVNSICADHVLFKDAPNDLDELKIERIVTRALERWQ